MALIHGTNILIQYGEDVDNFIYTSGINNPANMDNGGIYTCDVAMAAVAALISGLKAIGVYSKITFTITPDIDSSFSYTPTTTLTATEINKLNSIVKYYKGMLHNL